MLLLRFDFTISLVPGKELTTADALPRAPSKSTSRVKQEEEIELFVENILLQLPASDKRLEEIATAQKEHPICKMLFEYCKEGWPDSIQKFPRSLSPYWSTRDEISQGQGFLLKGPRLIIPASIRPEILDRIHDGHQGIIKCSRRTKESIWWPGLGKQLEEMVTNCHKCIEHRKPNRESMISSAVPERPRQVLGTDLFSLHGRTYLLVVDYFSRFIEISILASQKVKRYAH